MSKIIKLFMVFIPIILIATSCTRGSSYSRAYGQEKTVVVTSFYPIFIHSINITRDVPDMEVLNMTTPQTGCLHDYQLTPENLKLLEKSSIFIINGAGLEGFMDKVVGQMPHLKIVDATKGVKLLNVPDGHNNVNPHVWVSISGAIEQVKSIAGQLAELDSRNAAKYRSNAEKYVEKLEGLKERMHDALEGATNRKIITFHEAFEYFAEEFGLDIVGVIESEPGSEPGARELAELIEKAKRERVKALFAEPQYSEKLVQVISRETGVPVYVLDPVATGPTDEKDYDTYLNAMEKNLAVLTEALR